MAWELVEHIRNMSSISRRRAGQNLDEAEAMFVLAMLWVLPLASPNNLAELRYLTLGRIEKLLAKLVGDEVVGYAAMGHIHGKQDRYFLLPEGVSTVMHYWGVDLEWQPCRIPFCESCTAAFPLQRW